MMTKTSRFVLFVWCKKQDDNADDDDGSFFIGVCLQTCLWEAFTYAFLRTHQIQYTNYTIQ